jgi:anthranilate synthase/aminodeoxychorismate synthase-like glutamine amidotransferase
MILLVDNYDSFTYNLYQYLCELGAKVKVLRNDAFTLDRVARMKPGGIVISPGPGRPEDAGLCLALIKAFASKIPLLGVCLGHQSLAQAYGGNVVRAPRLFHGKTSEVKHTGKGLFKGLRNPVTATRYHSLIVERASLPACLKITAETADGIIMGLRHAAHPAMGLQFHPESITTEDGKTMLRNFLNRSKA